MALLIEVWQTQGTLENKSLIEQIVSVLVQVPIGAGGLPMVTLIMEIGVLSDKYTEDCQVGMLKLACDLLQDKLAIMDVPPTLVPHLATVISRFYRETSQDEHQQLRRSIMNTIIKL